MKPIIAGPCSAESEEQILAIAQFLATETSVRTMRAGVWKPRTRPGAFEGRAEEALRWLEKAKQQFGLSMAVEVATPEHVEACQKYHIDTVWIGARTTGNPFSVQDIAEALSGTALRVMVKNPMTPDVSLWLGAIERLERVGISEIIAIHRGFNTAQQTALRNSPLWDIPIELKRLRPDLMIYGDPSHIAGQANLVPSIAQKALDMAMDGLMIEVHPTPQTAFTDAEQQLDFLQFKNLLNGLIEKKPCEKHLEIEQLRTLIDEVDEDLIATIAKRMDIVQKLGQIKHQNQLTVVQMERWQTLLKNRLSLARKYNLNDEFILSLLKIIHAEAVRIQGGDN